MSWKNEAFSNFKLYAVTDLREESGDVLERIEAICRGEADIVQLRSKTLNDGSLYRLGLKIRKIAHRHQKLFFVNDRTDLALMMDADGVHLGQDDVPVEAARALCAKTGKKIWIGKSTHSIAQGLEAAKENPDYLGVGPVFKTPTKPDYKPAGLEYVRQAAAQIKIPFVAIGGIDAENLRQVLDAGAKRIAVVRALFHAADPFRESHYLKEIMEGHIYAES